MDKSIQKNRQLRRRKIRVRKKITGDAQRPRLSIYRSLRHMYAQLIDDERGLTLVSASTVTESITDGTGNKVAAAKVGEALAKKATELGIRQVRFDRNGTRYHGRVKAFADSAREAGLIF